MFEFEKLYYQILQVLWFCEYLISIYYYYICFMFTIKGKHLLIFTVCVIVILIYNGIFKEDLSTRFHYLSVENKVKYEKCLKDYKESYCDKHEIPYLEDFCLQLKICIESFESYSFLKKDVIASRLQLLIKYLFIDNVDLLLNNYIYKWDNKDKMKHNSIFNIGVVVIVALLFFLLPLYIVIRNIKGLFSQKRTIEGEKFNEGITNEVIIEEKY